MPEYLWIAALAQKFGIERFHHQYDAFLDRLDTFWTHEEYVALGLISDFALVPEDLRRPFFENNREMIEQLFFVPIGRILTLYPENPASWLLDFATINAQTSDEELDIGNLRLIIGKLLDTKAHFTSRVRVVPLNRLLKHGKVSFSSDLPLIELLEKYPTQLSEDDQKHVESSVRMLVNMVVDNRKDLNERRWVRQFWQHNQTLTPCRPQDFQFANEETASPDEGDKIIGALSTNANDARDYLVRLSTSIKIDLYDPQRDEVIFGLFARLTRLYCLLVEEPRFWARDIGGIVLRCLADTAITSVYLLERGTDQDYLRFKEYGEGQQKLLMLHLQDNYPDRQSLDGLSVADLADRFDIYPELLNIELGHWTKLDTRQLAKACNMEHLYRLVYLPASNELHGSWLSLKTSSLTYCSEPLHRYHRLPSLSEPPLFLGIVDAASELYEVARKAAVQHRGYPVEGKSLKLLSQMRSILREADIQ